MRAWMCLCGCGCKDVPGSQMKCPRGFRLGGGKQSQPPAHGIAALIRLSRQAAAGPSPTHSHSLHSRCGGTGPHEPQPAGVRRPGLDCQTWLQEILAQRWSSADPPDRDSGRPPRHRIGGDFGIRVTPSTSTYLGVTADSSPLLQSSLSQWRRCQPVRVDVARAPEPREMLWPSRYHGCAVHNPTFSTNTAGGLYPE
jgi:hypothetical protein